MRFDYWTIRVVPEPMGITSIGIGVIVMDPCSGAAEIRMRDDRQQFAGFQYEEAIHRLIRQLKAEIQEFVSTQAPLGFDEKLTLPGYLGFLSDHWMNLIRVDEVKSMDAIDLEAAVDLLFSRLIGGPVSLLRPKSVSDIRQAVRSRYRTYPGLSRAVYEHVEATIALRGLDLNLAVIGRDEVVELNQAFNLQSLRPRKTREAIENWTLKVEKLRNRGGVLEVDGGRRDLYEDVQVAAVVSRPTTELQNRNLELFKGFCKELSIDLVDEADVKSHAEKLELLLAA